MDYLLVSALLNIYKTDRIKNVFSSLLPIQDNILVNSCMNGFRKSWEASKGLCCADGTVWHLGMLISRGGFHC